MLAQLLLAPAVRREAVGGLSRRPTRLPHAGALRDLDQRVRGLPDGEDLSAGGLRPLVAVEHVLALLAEVRRARARDGMAAGERLDELVLGQAVGMERRPLAGAWVHARNATEARALVVRVAPVEAVEPDVALVPLRAWRSSSGLVPRLRHDTGVVGPRRDTSDGTKGPEWCVR